MLIFARRFFGFFLVPRGFQHFRREEENKRRSFFFGRRPNFIEQREPAEANLCDKFRIYNPKKQI